MADITPSAFQQRVLSVPEQWDLALLGGRGGGKSTAIALLMLSRIVRYEHHAKILYFRRKAPGIHDFAAIARGVFKSAFGKGVSYNQAEMRFSFESGAFVWCRPLDDPETYDVLQGQSFSDIFADECGQYASFALVEKTRSNMRGPKDMPLRMVYSANPGGPSHYLLSQRFAVAQPWAPTPDPQTGRTFVHCPSTCLDNPHIDQQAYRDQLVASANGNPDLIAAWLEGRWDALTAGNFFASVWALNRNVLHLPVRNLKEDWSVSAPARKWSPAIGVDHGSAAPCSIGLYVRSPGGPLWDARRTYVPRGSIIRLDEFHTARDDLTTGINMGIPRICEGVKKMCAAWGIKHVHGCGDDAMFANLRGGQAATIADEYRIEGVHLYRAKKGSRQAGWEKMCRMLADAGSGDRPGLYLNDLCRYAIATIPLLGRDERDPSDLDSEGPDHAADEIRYFINWELPRVTSGTTPG